MHRFNNFRVDYKIWLDTDKGKGILGEGKIELLRQINKTGSLASASAGLKISYRKAWEDIKNAEALLGVQLVIRKRGGGKGGTSELTEDAIRIISAWDKLHTNIDVSVKDIIKDFKKFIKKDS